MARFAKPFLLIGLAVVIVAIISWITFPAWQSHPGGFWQLLGVVVIGVVGIAKDLVEIIKGFAKEKEIIPSPAVTQTQQISGIGPTAVFQNVDQVIIQGEKVTSAPPPQEDTIPSLPKQGALPEPGLLPVGSRMPFRRNAVFTGREQDLLVLASVLVYASESQHLTITQPIAASGLGGIGKTQLVVEFCYRYGRWFEGIHWISAGNEQELGAEIAACGLAMELPYWPAEQEAQITATLRAWTASPKRLVVLDNLEDPEPLRKWLPRMEGVRLLVTTRFQHWPRNIGVDVYHLNVLPRDESRTLLRKLAPRLEKVDDAELDQLAERLGDLPLAVELAGRYLDECNSCTIATYLVELNKAGSALAHTSQKDWTRGSSTGHSSNLEATFDLSWQRLDSNGAVERLAKIVFQVSGYCAPNVPIPYELLWEAVNDEEIDRPILDRAIGRLVDLGLVRATDQGPTMHPLLSEYARDKKDDKQSTLRKISKAMVKVALAANETGQPRIFMPLLAHLEELSQVVEESGIDDASVLWSNLGTHKNVVADYHRALYYFERALRIHEKVFGREHSHTAIYVNNLGMVLHNLGDMAEAKECFERALRIHEKVFGPEHPDVAIWVNNLGAVLYDLDDLAGAKECFERALRIDKKLFDPEHPDVARDVNNLGLVRRDLGDLVGAKECFERALRIDEKVFGREHSHTARDVNNLGRVLYDLGDLAGAKECFERALRIDEKVFGPEHPTIALNGNNLGMVLQALGDLAGAKECFERALRIDEKVFGREHSHTARDVNNLGGVLHDLGDLAGAKECFERALRILCEFLPADHSNIQTVRMNLERLKKKMRDKE